MLSDNLFVYAEGGYFQTDTLFEELDEFSQSGKEYGFGVNWTPCSKWTIFADYWSYDVTGGDLFDGTDLSLGLEYNPDDHCGIGLVYRSRDGEFEPGESEAINALDFNPDTIELTLKYKW